MILTVALDLRSHGFWPIVPAPWAVPWWTGRLTNVAPVRGVWTPHAACSLTAVASSIGRGGPRVPPMDNNDLRLKIRDRLIKGALFPPPIRIWAGSGTGRLCVICGTSISSREVECEMTFGPLTIWAHHLPCHTLWGEKSVRLNLASHEEAGASDRESASP